MTTPTLNFQVEAPRGLLTGKGTIYRLGPSLISGLGAAKPKERRFELQGQDGSVAGLEYAAPRILIIDYVIVASTQAAAWNAVTALSAEYAASTIDRTLRFKLPGWGLSAVTGRPDGFEPNIDKRHLGGVIAGTARFTATDPTITTGL